DLFHLVFGRRPELLGGFEGGGEEGYRVDAKQRIFVGMGGDESLADRGLAGLYGALDVGATEQRAARVSNDFQLPVGPFVHALCELGRILRVEIGSWVGQGHVPGLRRSQASGERQRGAARQQDRDSFHLFVPRDVFLGASLMAQRYQSDAAAQRLLRALRQGDGGVSPSCRSHW